MVVVLNIDIIRALTGDYRSIIITDDEIKCQGYKKIDLRLEKFLDIGHVDTLNVLKDIIFDFMRVDIVSLEALKDGNILVIKRRDGKILKIENGVLKEKDEGVKRILQDALIRSIMNIIDNSDTDLRINITEDRVTIWRRMFSYPNELVITGRSSAYQDDVCFNALHLEMIDFDYLVDLLLRSVLVHRDIQIRCSGKHSDLLDEISFNIRNKTIRITGDLKYMVSLVVKSANYKDELRKAKNHQLKMKGF